MTFNEIFEPLMKGEEIYCGPKKLLYTNKELRCYPQYVSSPNQYYIIRDLPFDLIISNKWQYNLKNK